MLCARESWITYIPNPETTSTCLPHVAMDQPPKEKKTLHDQVTRSSIEIDDLHPSSSHASHASHGSHASHAPHAPHAHPNSKTTHFAGVRPQSSSPPWPLPSPPAGEAPLAPQMLPNTGPSIGDGSRVIWGRAFSADEGFGGLAHRCNSACLASARARRGGAHSAQMMDH